MSFRFRTSSRRTTATTSAVSAVSAIGGDGDHPVPVAAPPSNLGNSHLTTCLYQTPLGLFALTWSRHSLGRRSLRLHLRLSHSGNGHGAAASLSVGLQIKPLLFWTKRGSKKLPGGRPDIKIFWDFSRAAFGAGPEPESGFYVAVVVSGETALLVGDSYREAFLKSKANPNPNPNPSDRRRRLPQQSLILRKENASGDRIYATRARIGGKYREIRIDCRSFDDPGLCVSVDRRRALQVKRLKWKFRGNERIEVDGVPIQVSWDVYNWMFEDAIDGHAVFAFRFEEEDDEGEDEDDSQRYRRDGNLESLESLEWSDGILGFGIDGLEKEKRKKGGRKKKKGGFLRSGRTSSSSSLSSGSSSGGSSSVMEWASMEENELNSAKPGFSLLIYAWRS